MKILLLGKGGQVGWELQRALAPLGEVVGLDHDSAANPGGLHGDFSRPEALAATVAAVKPDLIVNAAAHTAVDKAESEPELARAINATAPAVLARCAAETGAWLVHYSTDYVFDGSGDAARDEEAATGPLSVYGCTKLEGEQAVARCTRHLTFRTSWVFAARGANFAKTMLRLAAERERLTVIDDQWGAPTGAELIADVSAHAIAQVLRAPAKAGLYHLAAAGETTWFSYANHVLAQARQSQPAIELKATEVVPVASSHFPTPARRPHNSRLDTRKLQTRFGLALPPWQHGVRRMLAEIL